MVYRPHAHVIVGIRHAQVLNPEGVVYARLPGFGVSELGKADAERLAGALARAPVAAVYASPLERAVETAAILAAPHGLGVEEDDRLVEWSFWVRWQGMPWSKIRERHPELLEAYGTDPATASPEDPLRTVGERVQSWVSDAERLHPEGVVLGVTHEAPLLAALLVGSGQDISDYRSLNLPHLGCVRLRPGPAEMIDLVGWARSC